MKVLCAGGRAFNNADLLVNTLCDIHEKSPITLIISGMARGADTLGAEWGRLMGIPVQEFPADWKRHGRKAGPIRNQQMLDEGCPDLVVAFPGGTGTAHMMRISRAAGVPVIDVQSQNMT